MIDDGGKLVGIISEGDLMHCPLLEQRILFGTGALPSKEDIDSAERRQSYTEIY